MNVLDLHMKLVSIPSLSRQEDAIADFVEGLLREHCSQVERHGNSVLAFTGSGPAPGSERDSRRPRLLLNSHLDTVPAGELWSRDPWKPQLENGRVYGLGANDAKASVASMLAAFLDLEATGSPCEVGLMLVQEEETSGRGTETVWPLLKERGWIPDGVVVGEPTGLNIATSQKGLTLLELTAEGDGGHSANADLVGARNAIQELARDLVAIENISWQVHGQVAHPTLGALTLQPTQLSGGEARNRVPERATCLLDLRTVPGFTTAGIIDAITQVSSCNIRVVSDRLVPADCPEDATIVTAARLAGPESELFGSRTMSDMVFFTGVPAIKCGPGLSVRSHQPDEFVLESELHAGVQFYTSLAHKLIPSQEAKL